MAGARDYFEGVRAARRLIDGAHARLELMRSKEGPRPHPFEAVGHASGATDPMEATRARMDAEAKIRAEVRGYADEVAAGRAVCAGVRAANPSLRWGDALEMRYCDDADLTVVASALGITTRTLCRDISEALDWVDAMGLARARAGVGSAC